MTQRSSPKHWIATLGSLAEIVRSTSKAKRSPRRRARYRCMTPPLRGATRWPLPWRNFEKIGSSSGFLNCCDDDTFETGEGRDNAYPLEGYVMIATDNDLR